MHGEIAMFVGWAALPLVAYVGASLVLARTDHHRGPRSAADAEARLEELRRWRDDGYVVPRGRMTDAVRMAQGVETTPTSHVRRG